jgi:hypothetical protein
VHGGGLEICLGRRGRRGFSPGLLLRDASQIMMLRLTTLTADRPIRQASNIVRPDVNMQHASPATFERAGDQCACAEGPRSPAL